MTETSSAKAEAKGRSLKRGIAVAAALGTVLAAAAAVPATAAAQPKTNGLAVAYSEPTPYSRMVGGIWGGAPVTMSCWIDTVWVNGTNRWFKVSGAGYSPYTGRPITVSGYVSASKIVNQVGTPHC